jgi:hypothetical protein
MGARVEDIAATIHAHRLARGGDGSRRGGTGLAIHAITK